MVGHELIERTRAGDEDRDACLAPPAGAAHLLPGGGDRAGVAGQDRNVQPTDVNAEFERIGAHHAQHLTGAQAGLDVAPLSGQIAAAVAAYSLQRTTALAERLAQRREQELDGDARL